ncbi:cysteine-rich protein 2-binding protein [Achroia grisella]|uniref:cysteine-rich protein 2-binding protein n=1 Tax=Achroia grisella TaxID=688607 RepID=UPI0027D25822|nr:cysteine-rich protein 2-binding protein [Achroia grisella]
MNPLCKYCKEPENKQDKPGLVCNDKSCFVHLACLRRPGTPGDFEGDVFFEFTCEDCSTDNKEVFYRNKFPWVNVILLTMHHLNSHSYGISNNGFFHYKIHICSFIDRHWNHLFGAHTKQKKNWVGTIAGVLSIYNNLIFQSGSMALGETGWWKLLHNFSPAVAAHIVQALAKDKPKGRPKNQMSLNKTLFLEKVTSMGYNHLINEEEQSPTAVKPVPCKKRRNSTRTILTYILLRSRSNFNRIDEYIEDMGFVSKDGSQSDVENSFRGFDFTPVSHTAPLQSDSSSIHSYQQILYYDSDSHSRSPNCQPDTQSDCDTKKPEPKPKKNAPEEKPYDKRESLFSTELNSIDMPWMGEVSEPKNDLVEMTQYEELQLLKQVEGLIPKVKDINKKAELHRLKAKLALRRLKRHKHLPLFDLDKVVKILGGYVTEDSRIVSTERILDRFQQTYLIDNLCGTIASTNYGTLMVSRIEPAASRSVYSGAMLKPYIRRDAHAQPTWLKLMDELLMKTNRHVENYKPPPRATIDYSYVRPQHIAAVNNLCAQFFWPGIDLTESLQYPEFSCVVTYRRLVVGCAFLVPDVGPNEAYISFILTRPEWRNAKIGSFMLYHLLQTCSGKDVTLHVSPTNPAIFLYQKFGFKVEELIQDFYEKYYDIDYKGCRHALFLRLIR